MRVRLAVLRLETDASQHLDHPLIPLFAVRQSMDHQWLCNNIADRQATGQMDSPCPQSGIVKRHGSRGFHLEPELRLAAVAIRPSSDFR